MKRSIYITVTIIFTVLTVGVNITRHFSGDELYSFSLFGDAKSCCEVPCDCCSEESDLYQLQADYIFSNSHSAYDIATIDLFEVYTSIIDVVTIERVNSSNFFVFADIPPPESKDYLSKIQSFLL